MISIKERSFSSGSLRNGKIHLRRSINTKSNSIFLATMQNDNWRKTFANSVHYSNCAIVSRRLLRVLRLRVPLPTRIIYKSVDPFSRSHITINTMWRIVWVSYYWHVWRTSSTVEQVVYHGSTMSLSSSSWWRNPWISTGWFKRVSIFCVYSVGSNRWARWKPVRECTAIALNCIWRSHPSFASTCLC